MCWCVYFVNNVFVWMYIIFVCLYIFFLILLVVYYYMDVYLENVFLKIYIIVYNLILM